MELFFTGLHQPSDAKNMDYVCISVNRLRQRKSDIVVKNWIMDSGAFTEISTHGGYRHSVTEYGDQIRRWSVCGNLLAAVAQDYMCELFIVEKTGLSIAEHQRLTIERYDALLAENLPVYIMSVLQGYAPADYVSHIDQYGERLQPGAWIGVGSVCKRNADARSIEAVLLAIHHARPDLRLHGFGIKATSLQSGIVRQILYSADSMAWSFAARRAGRNANDWREAEKFKNAIDRQQYQLPLFL